MDLRNLALWHIVLGMVTTIFCLKDELDEDLLPRWQGNNAFRSKDIVEDIGHLREHMFGLDFDWEKLQKEEVEFQFFKMHDLNDDNQLDGLEILSALRHGAHEHYDRIFNKGFTQHEISTRVERLNDRLAHTVDVILREDDMNNDGYLNYYEYANARRANIVLEQNSDNTQ